MTEKLYVKLTRKDGEVYTQEMPLGVMRMVGEGDDAKPNIGATLNALKKRVADKDDVLDYGDMKVEVVGEEDHLRIEDQIAEKQAKAQAEAEVAANSDESKERRARVEEAAKAMQELGYATAAEAVVDLTQRIKSLEELSG